MDSFQGLGVQGLAFVVLSQDLSCQSSSKIVFFLLDLQCNFCCISIITLSPNLPCKRSSLTMIIVSLDLFYISCSLIIIIIYNCHQIYPASLPVSRLDPVLCQCCPASRQQPHELDPAIWRKRHIQFFGCVCMCVWVCILPGAAYWRITKHVLSLTM